jgi:hypothetical protein
MSGVFQSKVVRRIFGPKRDEVTGEWRELYNEELNDICSSPNNIRVIKSSRINGCSFNRYKGEEKCIQGLG